MPWTLPEPRLSAPIPKPDPWPGWAGEPQWDGFRARTFVDAGQMVLRSRRGTRRRRLFSWSGWVENARSFLL
ncbi:hypothetical protein GCM10023084_77500 [Streptomyces lacrimifluminis]|uniref:Uncharacterized protein n=1 Tax=Streptomyces lacrimifluminis TaxID=1500077 RepID=A0A917UM85_9ACTN|nr:hypothetical protein GCM10012282_75990 [Streptomyces lacrimifluminis]